METWPAEIAKWAPDLGVAVLDTKMKRSGVIPKHDILIANYEAIDWIVAHTRPPSGIVFDELTRVKNSTGVRSKLIHAYTRDMQIRWGLTGSFTSNGMEDIFGQCRAISPRILGAYKTHYFNEYFTYNPYIRGIGPPKPDAFLRIMNKVKPYAFQLDGSAYMRSLPPLNIVDVDVMMDLTKYNLMKKNCVLKFDDTTVAAKSAEAVVNKLQQLSSGFMYADTGTKWLSEHKFKALEELREENQRRNMIVFYMYKTEKDKLLEHFPAAQTIESPDIINRWNAGSVPMLLLQPSSAGHGLNLQFGGAMAVFLTLPWSLELYEQAIGRLHRSGQTNPVWVYRILTHGTLDFVVASSLEKKHNLSKLALEVLK